LDVSLTVFEILAHLARK